MSSEHFEANNLLAKTHRAALREASRHNLDVAELIHVMMRGAIVLCEVNGEMYEGQREGLAGEMSVVDAMLARSKAFARACEIEANHD